MGTKRTTTTKSKTADSKETAKTSKKKLAEATLYIQATFNNTKVVLADKKGNSFAWGSAGALGFKGAKKGTPFAASKVGDVLAEKAELMGLKEFNVVIRGVGQGREPVIRSFLAKGMDLTGVRDETPIPHNGPRKKKPRRV